MKKLAVLVVLAAVALFSGCGGPRSAQATGKELDRIISRYEKTHEECAGRKSEDCANVLNTLGRLHYDRAKERFAEQMKAYGRAGSESQPRPDYSKSTHVYWQLSREYPDYPRLPEILNKLGTIYLSSGHLDSAKASWELVIERFPDNPRVSDAHFRLADIAFMLAFMDKNYGKAYEHLKQVKQEHVEAATWEAVHYRLGECAYRMGSIDEAVERFKSFVELFDEGKYGAKELRGGALKALEEISRAAAEKEAEEKAAEEGEAEAESEAGAEAEAEVDTEAAAEAKVDTEAEAEAEAEKAGTENTEPEAKSEQPE